MYAADEGLGSLYAADEGFWAKTSYIQLLSILLCHCSQTSRLQHGSVLVVMDGIGDPLKEATIAGCLLYVICS